MGERLRAFNWTATPLGSPAQWPPALQTLTSLALSSKQPMFIAWGPDTIWLYNDAFAPILGHKHPQALGQPSRMVWAEAWGDLQPLFAQVFGGEPVYMQGFSVGLDRNGRVEDAYFDFSYTPARVADGSVQGLFGACIETTERVLAQQRTAAATQRQRRQFDQAPGFICIMEGPQHVFSFINEPHRQLFNSGDWVGKPVREAIPDLYGQGYFEILDQVYQSGERYVAEASLARYRLKPDAPPQLRLLNFVYAPISEDDGRVTGIFCAGFDITDQRAAQDALQAFTDSIPAIAWVAGADGMLERFNNQWQAYTGQAAEQSLGRGWAQFIHPDDLPLAGAAWRAARHGNAEWQVEYRLRAANGTWRWFKAHAVPQLGADGRVLRWFGTTTDIEDMRRAAQALRDAARQKDEFLATLAHELRNPLAPMRMAVQLLATPKVTPELKSRATDVIGRQVGHMARLLDDLLDIARMTQRKLVLKREWIAVEAAVEAALEVARPLAEAKRHTLTVRTLTLGAQLMADPVRLTQILANLLNNASKYTDSGGTITLDVELDGDIVAFAVSDNGVGLTAQAIGSVFNMFAQEQSVLERSEGGLGIGLALVKGLVELHGGSVSAYSAGLGQGSRFEVRLPCLSNTIAPVNSAAAAPPTAVIRKTVLLADDNHDATDVLAELLRLEGHAVHTARDGLQALRLAKDLKPDVLVLDIGMPGLNGYEVARQLRAEAWQPRPVLIAATGWGQESDRLLAMEAGFDVHLTKPFDPMALSALIGRARS